MGIKGLWTILTPYSEKKPLHEIRGETIAVDLAGWVCDSQNVTEYLVQPKLYLRNLFFRTIFLLLADINPIFVLEGDAPELKRDVMAVRNGIQFRGAAPKTTTIAKKLPDITRNRFKNVLKECESLLKCMGVPCIKGKGEAEATCAQLNLQGLVDAVVSQDSDCFAYGARRVYRNFSVSSSSKGGAMQGSVDCYDVSDIYNKNGFGRNKMVALALMCGCDYCPGACGSSINTVVQFLHTVPDSDIIPRLLSWVSDAEEYDKRTRWVAIPGRCDRCGHVGRTHLKNGCPVCGTHRECNDLGHKSKVAQVKRELSLRSRALSCGTLFPEPKVMKEFLNSNGDNVYTDNMENTIPSLVQFVKLMTAKLNWTERYCVEKFIPLLTKFHFQDIVPNETIRPQTIKKKRNPKGVPSYEVVWRDIDGLYEGLIPDDQYQGDVDPSFIWTTVERKDLMNKYYPDIVKEYEDSIKKPPKDKIRKVKKNTDSENTDKPKRKYNRKNKKVVDIQLINDSTKSLKASKVNTSSLNISISVNKIKRKLKKSQNGRQKTMDSFIAQKKRKSLKKSMESLRLSLKNISVSRKDNNCEHVRGDHLNYLSFLNKSEDNDDIDNLSELIDNIVARPNSTEIAKVGDNLVKLVFDKYTTPIKKTLPTSILKDNCSTPNCSPIAKTSLRRVHKINLNNSSTSKVNTSYFFDKLTEDRDAFEMSLEFKDKSDLKVDCDTTIEYSLPDVCL